MPDSDNNRWTRHWNRPIARWGIIHLPTGNMLPQDREWGFTHRTYVPVDPQQDWCLPRLFPSPASARIALGQYLAGERRKRDGGEFNEFTGRYMRADGPPIDIEPISNRNPDEYAIVRVNLNIGRIEEFRRDKRR